MLLKMACVMLKEICNTDDKISKKLLNAGGPSAMEAMAIAPEDKEMLQEINATRIWAFGIGRPITNALPMNKLAKHSSRTIACANNIGEPPGMKLTARAIGPKMINGR